MPIRVVCAVTLHVELYNQLESSGDRIAVEQGALVRAVANAEAAGVATDPYSSQPGAQEPLSPDQAPLDKEEPFQSARPMFTLKNVVPKDWSVVYNTFRKPDEFECTLPLDLLPVPPDAVRSITCYAAIKHLGDDDWDAALAQGAPALVDASLQTADFFGFALTDKIEVRGGEIPTVTLKFHDGFGLLCDLHPHIGQELSHDEVISQAIKDFLVGTPMEGLDVVWVDTVFPEPTCGGTFPKAHKKHKGKKAVRVAQPKEKIADILVGACARVGCVPVVRLDRIEIATAGTIYSGADRGGGTGNSKATVLVGQSIESFDMEHELAGMKVKPIQVTSYNPDTGDLYTARWPPDPKNARPVIVSVGQAPRLPPVLANAGIAGAAQLDESVLVVPVAPVNDPSQLMQVAQGYFLERTRQRVKYTVKTHCPWADPANLTTTGGDLLALRAGDNVTFGFLETDDSLALLPASVRIVSSEPAEADIFNAMVAAGVSAKVADGIATVVAGAPRQSIFRVDELHVAGGEGKDAEIEIRLINYTVIVADLQVDGGIQDAATFIDSAQPTIDSLATATSQAGVSLGMAALYARAGNLPPDQQPAAFEALNTAAAGLMKGK